jgi:glutamate/tyrosine decarboxylase-like PLP-dependent enzyme
MQQKTSNPDGEMISKLEPPRDEIRRMGNEAVEILAQYYDSIRNLHVYPDTTAREIRSHLEQELPEEGEDFSELLDVFRDVILPFSRHNAHPRFFGYIAGPGTAATAMADLLASALNPTVTSWRSAPAATEIERLTINWIKQIIGYDSSADGLFTSGGSMANFCGLAAARSLKAPGIVRRGMHTLDRALRIYMSEECHHSIIKAAMLLGIGQDNMRLVRTDDRLRIDTADLVAKIEEDHAAGHLPFCVVASAGTVNTGAFDPLGEVAEVARRYNLWMHVDAAYGGFSVLAPSARHLFEHLADADSVALDPHKWLYVPVDCGCVLYRDPAAARAAFSEEAEYARILSGGVEEAYAFWDYGPEMTRRFRALKVWVMLRHVGTRALGEAIERNIACAKYLAQSVEASEDFEMLAPVELSIFCFRYVPPTLKRELETDAAEANRKLDAFNERLLIELQRQGRSYLTNARVHGRFALRGCVLNYRTTERDMEVLLDDVRQIGKRLVNA